MISENIRKRLENFHRIQVFDIIDLDILFMIIISYYISTVYKQNFYKILISIVFISIIIHRMFKINTRINEFIFGKV
jgi:hypothetical protein